MLYPRIYICLTLPFVGKPPADFAIAGGPTTTTYITIRDVASRRCHIRYAHRDVLA